MIGRGRLIADTNIAEFMQHSSGSHVRVVSPRATELVPLLQAAGGGVTTQDGALVVTGLDTPRIASIAAEQRIEVHELSLRRASLEEAFMELTQDSRDYAGSASMAASAVLAGTGN